MIHWFKYSVDEYNNRMKISFNPNGFNKIATDFYIDNRVNDDLFITSGEIVRIRKIFGFEIR